MGKYKNKLLILLSISLLFLYQNLFANVENQDLAKTVVKVKPLISEDDGYWDWFLDYFAKRSAQRYLVNENRVKLSMLAKQAKSKRSRWFKLLIEDQRYTEADLDASRGAGSSSIPFLESQTATDFFDQLISGKSAERITGIRNDLKAKRDTLRKEINAIRSEQRKLIDEVLNETQALHQSASTRYESAKESHPELKGEIDRLTEEQKLLKLELYDSAEWYAPHQLTKLVKEYEDSDGALPDQLDWLRVRAFIGEAEWLEEKVYLQLNAPTYQDPKIARKAADDRIKYWKDFLSTFSLGALETAEVNTLDPEYDPGDPLQVVARSARFDAMTILRSMHQRDPEKQDIVQALIKQELFFVQRIADKIDAEQQASMMAFYGYLKNRGFGEKDLKDDPNATFDALFMEQFWAGFGMGPITALSAISADDTFAGMPIPGFLFPDDWLVNSADAMAEIVGDAQLQSAQNRIAINALLRMMQSGLMLSQLSSLTPETMGNYLVDKQGKGNTLPLERRRALLRDIKEMIAQLPELNALISGDLISFSRAFGRSHYPSIYPEYAWYEWFGDLFSAKNIVFFWAPNAVFEANPAALAEGAAGASTASTSTTAITISGRDKFIQTLRLDKLSQWIANGRVGKTLLAQRQMPLLGQVDNYFKASRISSAYNLTSKVASGSAQVASSLLLYGGGAVLAQQQGYGPGTQLLIEAVAEIGFAGLLADAMHAGGIKPARIIAAADEITDRATKQVKAVEARNSVVTRVQEVVDTPVSDKTVAQKVKAAQKEASESFPAAQGDTFPQDLVEASNYTAAHTAKALKQGDTGGVTRAAKATKNVNKQLGEQAEQLKQKATKAKKLAQQAEAQKPPKSTITKEELRNQFVPTVDERQLAAGPYERFWAPKLHKEKIAGANLEAGDRAVRGGSLDDALDHYTEARRKLIEATEKKAANADQVEMLHLLDQRIAMILEHNETAWARKAAKQFAGELIHAKPISQDLANEVAGEIDAKLADELAPVLRSLNDDLDATRKIAQERLEGLADEAKRSEIIIAANKRIAELKSKKAQLFELDIPGVQFFREGPGSIMWKVEHNGETYFVKYSLQGADKHALQLDSTASQLADSLGINTFPTKLNKGQKNPLLVSRGVDVGADFGDLNDGEMLSFLDEYAEQTVFRAWLGDPDGHAGNLMLSKDGDLLPFDFDRAHLGDQQAHTMYIGHYYEGDEQALMRGSVLWSHGSIGDEVLDDYYKQAIGSSMRMVRDTQNKHYAAMARIQQMIGYKRLKKTVDKIKALADDTSKLKGLLEAGGWPDIETAAKVLKARADKLEDTLQPLFDKDLIDDVPRIVTSQIKQDQQFLFNAANGSTPCAVA